MAVVEAPDLNTRLTLNLDEAAAVLGVSRDHFDEKVRPAVKVIRQGRLIRVSVSELRRWVDTTQQ